MTASLPPLRDTIAQFRLDARRKLGQHFLLDENLTAKIARQAGGLAGRHVVEVGPGPGGYVALYSAGGGPEPYAWRHGLRFGFSLVMTLCLAMVDIRVIANSPGRSMACPCCFWCSC